MLGLCRDLTTVSFWATTADAASEPYRDYNFLCFVLVFFGIGGLGAKVASYCAWSSPTSYEERNGALSFYSVSGTPRGLLVLFFTT